MKPQKHCLNLSNFYLVDIQLLDRFLYKKNITVDVLKVRIHFFYFLQFPVRNELMNT